MLLIKLERVSNIQQVNVVQVPSLPPFRAYLHANYALWLNDNQLLLEERPPTEISDLSWDKHGCDDQYPPLLLFLPSASLLAHCLKFCVSRTGMWCVAVNCCSVAH
jgi:hypothetical protein